MVKYPKCVQGPVAYTQEQTVLQRPPPPQSSFACTLPVQDVQLIAGLLLLLGDGAWQEEVFQALTQEVN